MSGTKSIPEALDLQRDVGRNKMRNTKAKEIAMTTITSPEKDRKQL